MDKKNILYIDTPISPPGGGQESLLLVLKNINRNKFNPTSVIDSLDNPIKHELEKMNIPVLISKNSFVSIYKIISQYRPSLIHCNSPTTRLTFYSAVVSKLLRIPFVWHVRVTESAKWKDKLITGLSTKIIVISDAVKEKFAWIGNKNKVIKIHNAVDTKIFRPGLDIEYLLNEFNVKRDKKIVGIFSRIDPWKGHILFFNSARIIKDNIPNLMFLVAGEGEKEYKNQLINYVETLGLKNNVIFTGFRKDIPKLMNLCDVIVNPSIEPEPFGRVIIEAMACGKVVVATKIGGVMETVEDNVTGILVSPKNAQALAQACIYLLKNKEKAIEMGLNGRKRVEEFFSAEQNVEKIEQIYEDLI
ncbi:MAG: glycosyltransferase family 4 protein [Candidatus Aminicenantia bacterium]